MRRDTFRTPVRLVVGLALAGASWGCAADKLRISSHPAGAEVFIDDQFVGTRERVALTVSVTSAVNPDDPHGRGADFCLGSSDVPLGGP